jgi:hypothetical protein
VGAPNFIPGVAALVQELMRRLLLEPQGEDALRFLHYLARLEAYAPEALREAAAEDLVQQAAALRATDGRIVAMTSATVFPLALKKMTEAVAKGDLRVEFWAENVLMIATVAPWLTPPKRAEAETAISECVETVRRTPDAFRKAAEFAVVRAAHEPVPRLAVDFLATLSALPERDFSN